MTICLTSVGSIRKSKIDNRQVSTAELWKKSDTDKITTTTYAIIFKEQRWLYCHSNVQTYSI